MTIDEIVAEIGDDWDAVSQIRRRQMQMTRKQFETYLRRRKDKSQCSPFDQLLSDEELTEIKEQACYVLSQRHGESMRIVIW